MFTFGTTPGAGLVPVPTIVAYTTAKHGVVGLSTALRFEAAPLGVKVSVVCPGFVRTGIFETGNHLSSAHQEMVDTIASLKMISPTRCAHSILRGVAKNKNIITVTAMARIFWYLYRLHPVLLALLNRKMVSDIRKLRAED